VTLLIDPPLLVGTGVVIQRLVRDEDWRRRLEAAGTSVTLAAGIGFYTDAAWTRPLWPLLHIRSGRDWMLNTWVGRLESDDPPLRTHLVAALAFAAYPLWTRLGRRLAAQSTTSTASGAPASATLTCRRRSAARDAQRPPDARDGRS
jgi:hypothetical protein